MSAAYTYICPFCEETMEMEIEPFIPGNYSGRPENCFPDEGGYATGPEFCPTCGKTTDFEKVYVEWEKQNI